MFWQIVWLILQLVILTVVTMGLKIQRDRGDISVLSVASTAIGTLVYLILNDLILVFGGFFNCFF